MSKPGLRKIHRYSTDFKLTAVKLSHMPGVDVQTVRHLRDHHFAADVRFHLTRDDESIVNSRPLLRRWPRAGTAVP